MAQLKVRYHDGRLQLIAADRFDSAVDDWRFTRNGQEVARVSKKAVESITAEDVPDPVRPAPKVGAV